MGDLRKKIPTVILEEKILGRKQLVKIFFIVYNAWNKIDTVLYVRKRNYDESLLRKAKGDNQSLPFKSEIVSPVLNQGMRRTVVGACLKDVVKKVVWWGLMVVLEKWMFDHWKFVTMVSWNVLFENNGVFSLC